MGYLFLNLWRKLSRDIESTLYCIFTNRWPESDIKGVHLIPILTVYLTTTLETRLPWQDANKHYIFEDILGIVTKNDLSTFVQKALHWRHNDDDGVSNHRPHVCLLNRLFRCRSKKTSKLRVTGLCAGNSPGPVNSPHKGPVTRKCFHLMTSSWASIITSSYIWCIDRNRILFQYKDRAVSGPLFTKRTDVLPQDLVKSRSREIRV